mmetsp:Transcript_17190/g.32811  ORF Transcript_17190/g.32811 Transcript_17190/m.32811 type:complete len:414 (-) Transcript_17190:71-1312(-)
MARPADQHPHKTQRRPPQRRDGQNPRSAPHLVAHPPKLPRRRIHPLPLPKMTRITFADAGLTAEMLSALFQAEDGPYAFPLENMGLSDNGFGANGIEALRSFLVSRKGPLRSLHLHNNELGDGGAALLAEILEEMRISELDLSENQLTSEGLSRVFQSKNTTYALTDLCIRENGDGSREKEEIVNFLGRDDIALDAIAVGSYSVQLDIDWAVKLIRSLQTNVETTEILLLCSNQNSDWQDEKAPFQCIDVALKELVCNCSSVDALCRSNHVFSEFCICTLTHPFGENYVAPPIVKRALRINACEDLSINAKVRRKMQSILFRDGFDMGPFVSMKNIFIPHVLEIITRTEAAAMEDSDEEHDGERFDSFPIGNLDGIFHFVRNWQFLIFPDLETGCNNISRKRNRNIILQRHKK